MHQPQLLALFPGLKSSGGGVAVSGELARQALAQVYGDEPGAFRLFCYDRAARYPKPQVAPNEIFASTRFQAVRRAAALSFRPDLILCWHIDLLKLLPLLRSKRARVVLYLHGIEGWCQPSRLRAWLLRQVDLFLSNTHFTWERFLEFHPELQSTAHLTVPLGMAAPLVGPSPWPTAAPAALILSRLEAAEDYKGHRELIAAWPYVLTEVPGAQLWIAGTGTLQPILKKMVQDRGLEQFIQHYGWVTERQKGELLAACRCLAMPSRGEGFGLVYLEAMRQGRPCLVSAVDGGREVVKPPEAGLAVDPDEPRALAEALCRLLRPGPEWERWSRQAQARYEACFTARHFQDRLLSALFGRKGWKGR